MGGQADNESGNDVGSVRWLSACRLSVGGLAGCLGHVPWTTQIYFNLYIKGRLRHLVHKVLSALVKGLQKYKRRMSTSGSSTSSDIPIVESSATTATEPDTLALQPSHTNASNLGTKFTSDSSLWDLPGLDKDTFYAAALYLHAARGELKGTPLYNFVETPEATRDFLDRFADCFARSKLEDARDHVSATAMVRNEAEKIITIYIAKNQSEKGSQPFASQEELGDIANQNESFAKQLVDWFSKLASKDTLQVNYNEIDPHSNIFETMCKFSWSRLEHYISKVSMSDVDALGRVILITLPKCCNGWKVTKSIINECKLYHDKKSRLTDSGNEKIGLLTTYAQSAGQTRNHRDFRTLTDEVETSLSDKRPKLKDLAQGVKWINHLGQLWAAYVNFQDFCKDDKQSGYSFRHRLLRSEEDDWTGDAYTKKVKSWTGDLGLTHEREVHRFVDGRPVLHNRTVEALMDEVVETTGNKARVHCEMQLLMHFSQPRVEKCLDYFGCSKKSCWLCWQMILHNFKYSMKGTHRKIYPRWAFPFKFSPLQPAVAQGLRAAYNQMLLPIQDQVIAQKPLSTIEAHPQTSARMTPAHRRPRTGDDPGQGPLSGLFSSNPITVSDRFPAMRVPALHLPADDSLRNLRQVNVDAYECRSSDFVEELLVNPRLGDRSILFAFQLLTKPKPSSFTSDIVDFRNAVWVSIPFVGSGIWWELYYRPYVDGLAPNPHIVSIWRKIHRGGHQIFPCGGDVFIIPRHNNKLNEMDFFKEPSNLDHSGCFKAIEKYFKDMGAGYAKIRAEQDEDKALALCEIFNAWARLDAIRKSMLLKSRGEI